QLLRYADGESTTCAAGEIRSHLEACWQCRAELEELQKTVGECVRYRKNVLQRHLVPPAPWTDIYRGFAEVDAALDRAGFWERDAYRIRTRTGSGELIAATLTIHIPDLRPVEERLEFRNREWIEITEEAGDPVPPPAAIAASGGHPTARDLKTTPAGPSTSAS